MHCGICITCIISRNIHIALWHMHHMHHISQHTYCVVAYASYLAIYILRYSNLMLHRGRGIDLLLLWVRFFTVITLNASRISTANTYRSIGNIRCVLLHTPIRHSIFPWYHKFHLRSFHLYEQATNILLINACETGVYIPVAWYHLTFHEEVANELTTK